MAKTPVTVRAVVARALLWAAFSVIAVVVLAQSVGAFGHPQPSGACVHEPPYSYCDGAADPSSGGGTIDPMRAAGVLLGVVPALAGAGLALLPTAPTVIARPPPASLPDTAYGTWRGIPGATGLAAPDPAPAMQDFLARASHDSAAFSNAPISYPAPGADVWHVLESVPSAGSFFKAAHIGSNLATGRDLLRVDAAGDHIATSRAESLKEAGLWAAQRSLGRVGQGLRFADQYFPRLKLGQAARYWDSLWNNYRQGRRITGSGEFARRVVELMVR